MQPIVQGPIAAYAAPKVLGLNGPGITGADCAHPFENPTPLSQFLQLLLFFSVIAGLPYYYGRMINHRLHGWNIWLIMFALLIVTNLITWYFEAQPNPRMTALGVSPTNCNMEGKEVRIGIYNSATWANNVTITAEGANNCQHDSMMPMAGFMLHVQHAHGRGDLRRHRQRPVYDADLHFRLGVPGRPDDRPHARLPGQEDRSFDVKCCSLLLLMIVLDTVAFTAWSCLTDWGTDNNSQQRAARLQRIVLRLQLRDRQQRHGLRRRGLRADQRPDPRPDRQHQDHHDLRQHDVQLDADLLHADRPLLRDHSRAGVGGGPGQKEGRAHAHGQFPGGRADVLPAGGRR